MSSFSKPSEPTLPRNCRRHYNVTTPENATNGVWVGGSSADEATCYSRKCTGVAKRSYSDACGGGSAALLHADGAGRGERYVNYGVSHKSLMMIVIVQDMRNLSPCVKRSADYLLLYPSFNNRDVLYDLRRKTGHNYVELMKLCGTKDNITTVFNGVGPPLRRNIFEVIHFDEDDDDD